MMIQISPPRVDSITLDKIRPARVSYSIHSNPNGETCVGDYQRKIQKFYTEVNAAMNEAMKLTKELSAEKNLPIEWD